MSSVTKTKVLKVKCPLCGSEVEVSPSDIMIVEIKDLGFYGDVLTTKYKAFKCPACSQIIYKQGLRWKLWRKRYSE